MEEEGEVTGSEVSMERSKEVRGSGEGKDHYQMMDVATMELRGWMACYCVM